MTREEQKEFDRENRELNWIRPGLFKDATVVPETEPQAPAEYMEKKTDRVMKCIGIAALGSYVLSCAAMSVVKELSGFVVYVGLAAGVGLVGALARR